METVRDSITLSKFLKMQEWPVSLINNFINYVNNSPIYYFIIDDSDSMLTDDGKYIVNNKIKNCSRWQELCQTLRNTYSICKNGLIRSNFIFLNGSKYFISEDCDKNDSYTIENICKMKGGATPLCQKLYEIADEISTYADSIRNDNKKATIVIYTDGEPSDGDVRIPLQLLKKLPVNITLKLCNNQEGIVNFWNSVDKDLEMNLDILDDYINEADQIYKINPWLCYSRQLHTFREFGIDYILFDLLDEEKFTDLQIEEMSKFIGTGNIKPFCFIEKRKRSYIRCKKSKCVIS